CLSPRPTVGAERKMALSGRSTSPGPGSSNLRCEMRWTGVFGYLAAVVLATVLVSRWLGWTGWLVVICVVLALPLVVVLARNRWHPFRWSSALALLSGLALLGSLLSQYAGWSDGRD